MTLNVWFWLFMALWLIFGVGLPFAMPAEGKTRWDGAGARLLIFLLFFIVRCESVRRADR